MADEKFYVTKFINKSPHPYTVTERTGTVIALIPAGEKLEITSHSATTRWSRFKEITIGKDGRVTADLNRKWKSPWDGFDYMVELVNETPVIHSIRFDTGTPVGVASGFVRVLPGVPELVPATFRDQMAQFEKIVWKEDFVFKKIPMAVGYFYRDFETVTEKIRRSNSELKKIMDARKAEAERKAQAQVEREMKLQAAQLGVDDDATAGQATPSPLPEA